MKKIYFCSFMMLVLAGCAMKTKVLDAAAISMTRNSIQPGEKIQETGAVTGKFCADTFGDKGNIGLLDQSVKAAQDEHKIDFIMNASFWREGSCLSVEGTGGKVVASAATSGADTPPAVPSAPAKKGKKK